MDFTFSRTKNRDICYDMIIVADIISKQLEEQFVLCIDIRISHKTNFLA